MATDTKIEWCNDTFNMWRGCAKVSPGCKHCYAEAMSKRNPGTFGEWGVDGTRILAAEHQWNELAKSQETAVREKARRRVFVASVADVFEDWPGQLVDSQGRKQWINPEKTSAIGKVRLPGWVPAGLDDVRRRLFMAAYLHNWLDFLFLTKRPENIGTMLRRARHMHYPHDSWWNLISGPGREPRYNWWFGTTVENQDVAATRIGALSVVPAAVRFLSVEPMLGPVDLARYLKTGKINWVICGGESGHHAREFQVEWARSLRDQCLEANVPFFMKQTGQNPMTDEFDKGVGDTMLVPLTIKSKKGDDWDDLPVDLRIREFPAAYGSQNRYGTI